MEEILHQLIGSLLIIYRILYIPSGAGFFFINSITWDGNMIVVPSIVKLKMKNLQLMYGNPPNGWSYFWCREGSIARRIEFVNVVSQVIQAGTCLIPKISGHFSFERVA